MFSHLDFAYIATVHMIHTYQGEPEQAPYVYFGKTSINLVEVPEIIKSAIHFSTIGIYKLSLLEHIDSCYRHRQNNSSDFK